MDSKELRDGDVPVEEECQCCVKRSEWEEKCKQAEDTADNKVLELMAENWVLDCEKKKAETEVQIWKSRCKELECRVIELESRLTSVVGETLLTGMTKLRRETPEVVREKTNVAKGSHGRPSDDVSPLGDGNVTPLEEGKRRIVYKSRLEHGNRARNQLIFGEEISFSKKIAPATPAGVKPASGSVIDITDSDDEADASELIVIKGQGKKEILESTDYQGGASLKKQLFPSDDLTGVLDKIDEDSVTFQYGNTPISASKRKRASNIVTSDSESDTEPISSRLRTKCKMDASSSWDEDGEPFVRRRLVTLRNLKENRTFKEGPSNSKSRQIKSPSGMLATPEEDELLTESGSLDDFIVSDNDISNSECTSKDDRSNIDGSRSDGESGDESDGDTNYGEIIGRIGRCKGHKLKWEYEADMTAAFGKDPKLCMKAVCALYRQQTSDEKIHKAAIVCNRRGFDKLRANSGCKLGEFLTDGDPQGDMCKSVDELEEYDPKGVRKCRDLAMHYSGQLFEIYRSGEDPLWLPSESK